MTDKNLYSRHYWEGGLPDGSGYKGIYGDFPVQLIVVDKIMGRKPDPTKGVLDIGASRGFTVKHLQQRGISAYAVDLSEYAEATRVTSNFARRDIEKDALPFSDKQFDIVYSVSTFEHLEEDRLPFIITEISRVASRGIICPSFYDVGTPDKTHRTLKPKEWWQEQFAKYAPNWPVEIIDKEEWETGRPGFQQPQRLTISNREWTLAGQYVKEDIETLSAKNNRAVVLNISSYTVMFRSNEKVCVVNTDVPKLANLGNFAVNWGSNFTTYEAPGRLPFKDNSVSEIYCSHMLEHLDRKQALEFLQECKRVLKTGGSIRILVPDLQILINDYCLHGGLSIHKIYNADAEKAEDDAQIFFHMLTSGKEHMTAYDPQALEDKLINSGFDFAEEVGFDNFYKTPFIGQVGYDMFPEISLIVVGTKLT